MVRSKGKTHFVYKKKVDGVTTVATHMSFDRKQIGDHLGGKMAEQCRLRLADFWGLIDCSVSEEDWNAAVRQWLTSRTIGPQN